jgi:hypothetical protein
LMVPTDATIGADIAHLDEGLDDVLRRLMVAGARFA